MQEDDVVRRPQIKWDKGKKMMMMSTLVPSSLVHKIPKSIIPHIDKFTITSYLYM